ncbi:hypothetical protein [Robertmurraya mangrovi]|uniref:hypothetical protein n=1 Tax=Robertmurraya mangrovi TaxID=3098077 RepID=UPI00389A2464
MGQPGGFPGFPGGGQPGGFPGFPGGGQPGGFPGFPGGGQPGGFPGFPGGGQPGGFPGFPGGGQPGGTPGFPGGGQTGSGNPQAGPPTSPPPSFTPQLQQSDVSTFAVDPGAIRRCLFRFTFVWLNNGRSFWFYPTFVGRDSVAGYRWRNFRWVYYGTDLRRIRSFQCV